MFIVKEIEKDDKLSLLSAFHLLKKPLNEIYPEFNDWFSNHYLRQKKCRKIYVAVSDNEIVGVALIKDTPSESKISTIFVKPSFRRNGVADALIKKTLNSFKNNRKVHASFNQSLKNSTGCLFSKWRFKTITQQGDEIFVLYENNILK